ncbi:MAG TPA: glutaredoxin domain-containing protein [Solirubrobacterales bacterium]|jgi:monothiol glutaredoxin|nr:glutaredoxin domain-containing protein [Solirubrobacterales bacterium]
MTEPTLKDRLEQLIAENRVLLLMKGTPEAPACGNSMRAVAAIEPYGVEYAALDVLPAMEPLREVTGEIADWRTFPQLYVNGELVGGADIVEEMNESGELAELLGVEQPERPQMSAKEQLKADDPQQSPPIQIKR